MEDRLNPQNSIFSALSSESVTALIFRLDFNNRQCLYLNKQKSCMHLKQTRNVWISHCWKTKLVWQTMQNITMKFLIATLFCLNRFLLVFQTWQVFADFVYSHALFSRAVQGCICHKWLSWHSHNFWIIYVIYMCVIFRTSNQLLHIEQGFSLSVGTEVYDRHQVITLCEPKI